jgi:hypothetical protein
VSAGSPAITADLCAELREQLIAFLQREHPDVLPRQRTEIIGAGERKAPGVPGEPPARQV